METEIRAGATIDVLTANELRTVLEEVASGYLRDPYRVRIDAGGETDSDGLVLIDAFARVRPGFQFLVNRLVVSADGYSFPAPFTAADLAVEVLRAPGPGSQLGEALDGFAAAASGTALPWVLKDGNDRAVDLVNQEVLQVRVTEGPPSVAVTVKGHGTMIPLAEQGVFD